MGNSHRGGGGEEVEPAMQSRSGSKDRVEGGSGGHPGGMNSTQLSSVASFSSRGQLQSSDNRSARSKRAGSFFSLGISETHSDDEEFEDEHHGNYCPCSAGCSKKKEFPGLCYFCFVLIFFSFLLIFPLFFKWLKISPMPSQYWNEEFEEWPALEDKDFIKDYEGWNYRLSMSAIPSSYHGCNFSCIGQWVEQDGGEVAFPIEMNLDAKGFPYTAYPVILASNDFGNRWWVASDRSDAITAPFFPTHLESRASVYKHVTDECNRPPEVNRKLVQPADPVLVDEGFSSVPVYIMVCVTWSWDSIQWLTDVTELDKEDIAEHCMSVGGVCGWPCEGGPEFNNLPGCTAGKIDVGKDGTSFAGTTFPNASFQGTVKLRACLNPLGTEECQTHAAPLGDWPCHTCAVRDIYYNVEVEPGVFRNKTFQHRYESLPKMQVTLEGVQLESTDAVPRAYILSSPVNVKSGGPDGFYGGKWKKLYYDYNFVISDPHRYPYPLPLDLYNNYDESEIEQLTICLVAPWVPECQPTQPPNPGRRLTEAASQILNTPPPLESLNPKQFYKTPMLIDTALGKMKHEEANKVVLNSQQCFTARGALYLVACAVNESTYMNEFAFKEGQEVAPPPFNDRCLAVTGRCGYACTMEQEPALKYCDEQGRIPQDMLLWDYEIPNNDAAVVFVFIISMIVGFSVKLMTYCPGLFLPEKSVQFYHPKQTDQFKYIAVVTPSGGETKACVMRNLVGAMSSLPVGCECPFHVVFADEGHRHAHKVCFQALVKVFEAVPEIRLTRQKDPNAGNLRNRLGKRAENFKEDNLKSFTKEWVESIRTLTLKDCETAKMGARLKKLEEEDEKDPAVKDEKKKINQKLERITGAAALLRLHQRQGWPVGNMENEKGLRELGEQIRAIQGLEEAIARFRQELLAGEREPAGDGAGKPKPPVAMHLDDCESFWWQYQTKGRGDQQGEVKRLYTLHYVARARPDEDERTLKVQHVARGCWYYRIPRDEDERAKKEWLEWRKDPKVYQDGEGSERWFIVPVRTSRGKAGGLNFVENYLYDYTRTLNRLSPILKYSLFSIADARHQYQPDFFHETIPSFFKQNNKDLDVAVAFTQTPQYFPEMPDDVDYLDTNNANFFRLNCMLRNCCGGVSSCGTNGTWMVRDRRAGFISRDSIWEETETPRLDFLEKVERRFFHESCKVEDTASSLDRVVKGKYSRYINLRLSYGMAKDPTDYLAAVQRWAEGGVVLALQTFFGCREGIHMIWMALMLFALFIASLVNLVYGWGYIRFWYNLSLQAFDDDRLYDALQQGAEWCADLFIDWGIAEAWFREGWTEIFLDVMIWFILLVAAVLALAIVTTVSFFVHYLPCFDRGSKRVRRTRFPTTMAQWARLAITLDNLTYFLWFWTAFFWIGFNYYGIWGRRWYHFEANGMVLFSYLIQILGWSLVISASARYRSEQGQNANEVFFLSLTNVWRTTQLFYINAPLTLYSLFMGFSDFIRNRMLDVDISYWVGGDRGEVSKLIAQWWTLSLIFGAIISHIFYWSGWLEHGEFGGLLIVTFIGLDVMHPCAFLWLGPQKEKLPAPPSPDWGWPKWQRAIYRFGQLLISGEMWRNAIRSVVFHPRSTFFVKWIGPVQNCLFPVLTWFFPEFGINQALLLLASSRT